MPESVSLQSSTQSAQLLSRLQAGLEQMSIQLSDAQTQSCVDFIELLLKWNRIYNLTAVRDPLEMVARHLLDSLSVKPFLPGSSSKPISVLDVGSGAGLPVIPLAIAVPDNRYYSVESNGKKTRFQQQAAAALKLSNFYIQQERIESVSVECDVVISRAFTAPEEFLRIVSPNCVSGGHVLIMLGQKERLPTALPAPFQLMGVHEVNVPFVSSTRHVAVCHKS